MAFRKKAHGGHKKQFSRTAGMTHKANIRAKPMRGGYRM